METSKTSDGETLFDLTSYVGVTPVSRSAQQEKDKAQTTHDTCGLGLEKPLASYDPDTQSWRTYEATLVLDSQPFLGKWPASGMTQNGKLFQQPRRVPRTLENASSSWPTPTAVTRPMEGNVRLYRAKIEAGEMTEAEAEAILGKSVWEAQGRIPAMWPTPTTQEVEHPNAELTVTGRRKSKNGLSSHSLGLADAVQMWPTPTASSWGNEGSRNILDRRITDGTITPENKRQMTSGNGGRLNPTWVEWLMGFPLGWTDLKD
jgi:hypothetical protein